AGPSTRCSGKADAMNEADWDACDDPDRMLKFVGDRAGERKLRLFACACVRRIWYLLTDERSQRAVEVSEQYPEGLVSAGHLAEAARGAADAYARLGAAADVLNGAEEAWTLEGLQPADAERCNALYRATCQAARDAGP